MTDPCLVMATVTYPDGHVEAEPLIVSVIDDQTVALEIEGLLVCFEAKEFRRAVAGRGERRNAA